MDELLPHYERELAFLRTRSADFARRYPKIAGRLQLTGDVGDDPHVERLMESFAFLSSRIHKRLDDDFPLFTESLLEVLYPHYLRPFPSCSIACLDLGAAAGQMSKSVVLPRGTAMTSRAVKGVTCRFRTTQDVRLVPVRVSEVSFRNAVGAPPGSRVPAGASSVLSITLDKLSPQMSWQAILSEPLSVYLDGEASQISALRGVLCNKALAVMVQWQPHHPWQMPPATVDGRVRLPTLRGFVDDEALIDWDERANPAYRLLTEYFAFPEKFNFVELPALAVAGATPAGGDEEGGQRSVVLHIPLREVRADSDESRLLETVAAHNVVLGATPVVNLFKQPADPIRITHKAADYPVVVDARKAYGYELYALDRVYRVRQTTAGEAVDEVRPFFSLQHDELWSEEDQGDDDLPATVSAARTRQRRGGARCLAYWQLQRDEDVALHSPGYEVSLTLVDESFDPVLPSVETLSLDVTATNRDLPSLLAPGTLGGDLFMEGGGPAKEIRLLRKPTSSQRFERGRGALWRLISHLSLNHLSLSGGGIDALKEMLRLYDLPRSASNRRQLDGLVAIEFRPATAWLQGEPYASFVRGTEVRLSVDEGSFVGTGLGLFAAVLDHFFGLYVHANSFTKLTLVSARTQEEVLTCPPRNGELPLV